MKRLARRLGSNQRGNIAIIFALSFMALVVAGGGAMDVSQAVSARAQLQSAADAASLAAIAPSSQDYKAGLLMSGDGPLAPNNDAQNFFNSAAAALAPSVSSFNNAVTKTGGQLSSTVTIAANSTTTFLGMIGIAHLPLSVTATSSISMPLYADFYLLLDNTPSMGLGASSADIATMIAHTPDRCAFACHDVSGAQNYYAVAKVWGVTMRIDLVRQATQQLTQTATQMEVSPNQFRMALYDFGVKAEAMGLTTVSPLTSSLTTVQAAAGGIDLMTIPYQNYNTDTQTNFAGTMASVNAAIPTPGNGLTPAAPQKVLFFVSDGMTDTFIGSNRTFGGIDQTACTAMKARGVKIAVLYTTYLPLTDSWSISNVMPFLGTVAPAMQACASPGLYFEVNPTTQGISQAMQALFQRTITSTHLTS